MIPRYEPLSRSLLDSKIHNVLRRLNGVRRVNDPVHDIPTRYDAWRPNMRFVTQGTRERSEHWRYSRRILIDVYVPTGDGEYDVYTEDFGVELRIDQHDVIHATTARGTILVSMRRDTNRQQAVRGLKGWRDDVYTDVLQFIAEKRGEPRVEHPLSPNRTRPLDVDQGVPDYRGQLVTTDITDMILLVPR